jgi:polysaccharide export outer membrane protein
MSSRVGKVGARQEFVRTIGLGLAVFFLAGLATVWGQETKAAPDPQDSATSNPPAAATPTPDASKATEGEYTVSPEDLLDIEVMDVPEVSRTYRVSSNGLLTLPLLPEPLQASGETLDQLSHLIAAKFHDAGMLNNAHVLVSLKETRLHTVLVTGEVKSPQSYPIYGPTKLIDVLVKAGGLSLTAGDDAIIARGEAGMRADLIESTQTGGVDRSSNGQSFSLNIRKLVETGDDSTNITLYPGDRVTVQRAELVYVLGAVARPGGYVLSDARQHTTVLKALAMAGDVNNVAKKSHIVILRRDPTAQGEKRQEIPIDYKAMVKGQIADVRLVPDDIVFVPESGSLKALHASSTAAMSIATGGATALMIYR